MLFFFFINSVESYALTLERGLKGLVVKVTDKGQWV